MGCSTEQGMMEGTAVSPAGGLPPFEMQYSATLTGSKGIPRQFLRTLSNTNSSIGPDRTINL